MQQKIEFNVNYQKCIEVVLYLIENTKNADIYHILKRVFSADKYHLNKYARPVTGDSYFALKNGTVPSAIYDILKGEILCLQYINDSQYPFKKIDNTYYFEANRSYNAELLSESDIEALSYGINEYTDDMDFRKIEDKNHNEECWKKAWNERRDALAKSSPIYFEDMIDDQEIIEDLQQNCKFLVV